MALTKPKSRWLTYIAPFKGAKERSVKDKLSDKVSVTDFADLLKAADFIGTSETPVTIDFPAGSYEGDFMLKSGNRMVGAGSQATVLTTVGVKYDSKPVRGSELSRMTITAKQPSTGNGLDGADKSMVNCRLSDIYINNFDVGYKAGATDFSCTFDNVRVNSCRINFDLTGQGGIIQNTFNNCYSSAASELGMKLAGVSGLVFNGFNSGSTGGRHLEIGLNSKAVIFNAPNFEQDAGELGRNKAAVTVLSGSEVTFNSPTFVNIAATTGSTDTYLMRVQDSAVVYINAPVVKGNNPDIKHLYVAGNAVVYLNDPNGAFSKIDRYGSARVVNVSKVDNAPDFIGIKNVKSGDTVDFGWHPKFLTATPDFHSSTVPNPFKYAVHFDTFGSKTASARVIDTTTGSAVVGVTLPVLIQAWKG